LAHVRIARHYFRTTVLLTALAEGILLLVAPIVANFILTGDFSDLGEKLLPSLTFALVVVVSMLSMGVYESKLREGMSGMMLRTAVAVFLLGAMATALLSYVVPEVAIGRSMLLLTCVSAFMLLALWRALTGHFLNDEAFKRRIVVLGSGQRALKIASRMRRRLDRRSFILVGFIEPNAAADSDEISELGAHVIRINQPIAEFCRDNSIDEIVVAMDERRRNGGSGLPLEELMEARLQGVEVCEVQQFIEREAGKVDVDLLRPSWIVFSDGFIVSAWRSSIKRTFDLFASSMLMLFVWPIMLVAAIAIWLEGRGKDPVLYRQERIGLDGKPFEVLKFRSMTTDAEKEGQAVWAKQNDPRVTRVGTFIRKTRIDELPQLFNVLKGNMSFVGPRPERPVFVDELEAKIPYYAQRHRVKPGITGWAQLRYPYGASVEDAKQKLQFDLYYLKNNSLLLDLIILVQTVEVVLVGEGAR
jgi:sugar transferase (PEP-CTERM system associated)